MDADRRLMLRQARRRRRAESSGQPSRALTAEDDDDGIFIGTWILADMGPEGAMEYKQGRMEDWMAWNTPAALLMTVSFAFMFSIAMITVEEVRYGFPYEEHVRYLLFCVYLFSMSTSALLALKCINDHTLNNILPAANMPSKFLPEFNEFKKKHWAPAVSDGVQYGRAPDEDHLAWADGTKEGRLHWEQEVAKWHQRMWVRNLFKWLQVPGGAMAYLMAIDMLNVGIFIGIFLEYGLLASMFVGPSFFLFSRDFRAGMMNFVPAFKAFSSKLQAEKAADDAAEQAEQAEQAGQNATSHGDTRADGNEWRA